VDPEPHVEHRSRRTTGRLGLDVVLGVSAVLISVISLFVAIHQSQVADKMVQADTWPYLDFAADYADDPGHEHISLTVLNSGVGPAKIESIEVTDDGTPLKNGRDLLRRCCTPRPVSYLAATVPDRVLPPKETLLLFSTKPATLSAEEFAKLDAERAKIQARICYCSVLDKCWMRDTTQRRAQEVDSCPVAKTPFGGGT
jgi:hypothetical protein